MLRVDSSDPAATGQSGRGRALLEQPVEHRLRPARHGQPPGEDHDRRRRRVHAYRVDARPANHDRLALSARIDTSACSESIAGSVARGTSVGAIISARRITGSHWDNACCITSRFEGRNPGQD